MKSVRTTLIALILLALLPEPASCQDPAVPAIVLPAGSTLPRERPRSLDLPAAAKSSTRIRTPAINEAQLLAEDSQKIGGPQRAGIVLPLNVRSSQDGKWTTLNDGGSLWTVTIETTGAKGVRLRFSPWRLVDRAQVTVYDARDPAETFGPFTRSWYRRSGEFWTPILYAGEVTVEYFLPPGVDRNSVDVELTITGLGHLYNLPCGQGCGTPALPCHNDVSCFPDFQAVADGVAQLMFVDNMGNPTSCNFCSGTMLNRVGADLTPMFATATHCGVTDDNADTVAVTWFFQTDSCNGVIPNQATLEQTLGVTVLASDVTTDWTLMGIASDVPGGVTFNGWNAGNWVAVAGQTQAVGIHHPRGEFKRISFGLKNVTDNGVRPNPDGTNTCVAGTAWSIAWTSGMTEPASSGSPIFDANQIVRGVLSCGSSSCMAGNSADYGRLDQAWALVQPYLDPTNPVYCNSGFGGTELGTTSNPFNSLIEASFAVIRGSTVYVNGGAYPEQVTIDKAMTLQAVNGTVVIGN